MDEEEKLNEDKWSDRIRDKLRKTFSDENIPLFVETRKKIPYISEISSFDKNLKPTDLKPTDFEVDFLVYEENNGKIIPSVIVEAKFKGVTTHDAITYSQKAALHKNVMPNIRYGIMLGAMGDHDIPGRLLNHGTNFDFMFSFSGENPTDVEWKDFEELVKSEVDCSKQIERMRNDTRSKDRAKFYMVQRKLIAKGEQ